MNFNDFGFDKKTSDAIAALENNNCLPHAIIIESSNDDIARRIADYLAMFYICRDENRPCGKCVHCQKISKGIHPDVTYPKPENKSKTYSIRQITEITEDSAIAANDSDSKVYIFERCDERLNALDQNSLLKLIEEPPENRFFIFICKNSRSLLLTIRSRCATVRAVDNTRNVEIFEQARTIVKGIISLKEYDLLLALRCLANKESSYAILGEVRRILCDGLLLLSGSKPVADYELADSLSARFTRKTIIDLLQLTSEAAEKVRYNINFNLFTTRLCGEYRRISWQR